MALSVQNIVDAVSTDVRQVISNSGADATLMIGWVDRIHKDCLHSSFYNNLVQGSTTVSTVAGTGTYTLSPGSPIRRILQVFDRTFSRVLLPFEDVAAPQPLQTHIAPPGAVPPEQGTKFATSGKTMGPWPEYYKFIGTTTLVLYPAPANTQWAGTIEVQYEFQATTLANLTDVLVIPEDGKDMVVAGVNYYALSYLKIMEEAALWLQIYEKAKRGELIV